MADSPVQEFQAVEKRSDCGHRLVEVQGNISVAKAALPLAAMQEVWESIEMKGRGQLEHLRPTRHRGPGLLRVEAQIELEVLPPVEPLGQQVPEVLQKELVHMDFEAEAEPMIHWVQKPGLVYTVLN